MYPLKDSLDGLEVGRIKLNIYIKCHWKYHGHICTSQWLSIKWLISFIKNYCDFSDDTATAVQSTSSKTRPPYFRCKLKRSRFTANLLPLIINNKKKIIIKTASSFVMIDSILLLNQLFQFQSLISVHGLSNFRIRSDVAFTLSL